MSLADLVVEYSKKLEIDLQEEDVANIVENIKKNTAIENQIILEIQNYAQTMGLKFRINKRADR